MKIRPFRIGDEAALHRVFLSAVHEIARHDYTAAQLEAWAPRSLDTAFWAQRMQGISPFVVEHEGVPVAYADLQPDGYIDHFFVSRAVARQGVGSMLMRHILSSAQSLDIRELTSDVSRTAQPFFEAFGFAVVEQRLPEVRGVVVPNALMRKVL